MSEIILASSSQYRKELLERLGLPFAQHAPHINENRLDHELPEQTAARLALEKARTIQSLYPNHVIIGSDQTACIAETTGMIGKPHTHEQAVEQLLRMQGQKIHFYTAVCLLKGTEAKQAIDCTTLHMRPLQRSDIEAYLAKEPAYDVAGSAKIEGLGISLMDAVHSTDPTALIGLPLITVARFLREFGIATP